MATAKKKNATTKAAGKDSPKASKTQTKSAASSKKSKTNRASPKSNMEARSKSVPSETSKTTLSDQDSQFAKEKTALDQAKAAEPGAEHGLHEASQEGEAAFQAESAGRTTQTSTPETAKAPWVEDDDREVKRAGAKSLKRAGAKAAPMQTAAPSDEDLEEFDEPSLEAEAVTPTVENRVEGASRAAEPQKKKTSETIEEAGESARMIDAMAQTQQTQIEVEADAGDSEPKDNPIKTSPSSNAQRPSASQEGESALSAKEAITAAREAINSARVALTSAKDAILAAAKDAPADERKNLVQELSGTFKSFVRSVKNHGHHP